MAVSLLAALMLALLFLPLLALAIRAVGSAASLPGMRALASRPALEAVRLSLSTTAISVLIIAGLGTPLAYVFARYRFPLKRVLNMLVELPIVLPPVVAGLALLLTFGRRGLLGEPLAAAGLQLPFSTAAVVIAQVFVAAPFFIRAAQVQFRSIPPELEEAASMDGASGWQVFWHIILPLSARGLVVGVLLSWARALGEFGATILFAGNLQGRTQTMPLFVYSVFERDFDAALWAALLLVGVAVAALALGRWLARSIDDGGQPEGPASL